jgi:transposase
LLLLLEIYHAITPIWLEKSERIAALAMVMVFGLLVYRLIQRQVLLYLRAHQQQVPGNKGLTTMPTAAVVMLFFGSAMQVHGEVEQTSVRQVYGWQTHHAMVCDAVGIDPSWYDTGPT